LSTCEREQAIALYFITPTTISRRRGIISLPLFTGSYDNDGNYNAAAGLRESADRDSLLRPGGRARAARFSSNPLGLLYGIGISEFATTRRMHNV